MHQRRVLVIGSQCKALNHLSFLPKAAEDLYKVMIDPELGGCVPALERGGLICDPSVIDAIEAIELAFQRASQDEATFFLAFVGHGEYAGEDFYLLPKDASVPPMSHKALNLVQLIKELCRVYSYVDGLVVLLDTCYAGVAAIRASVEWVRPLKGTLRFEVLSAAADRPAADGCFSRSLTQAIRKGLPDVPSEYLRCEKVRSEVERLCVKQTPQHPSWATDDGLYLAKNVARFQRKEPWIGTSAATEIERLLSSFQPTPELEDLVKAVKENRYVALIGAAGIGKSALAAALARPDLTEGIVPEDFVQAVVFISEATTSWDLASTLSTQLQKVIPDFVRARNEFFSQVGPDGLAKLDRLQRDIVRPLELLGRNQKLRIVVDGLDRLSAGAALPTISALKALATDDAFRTIQLLVTSRPDTLLPASPAKILAGRTDNKSIVSYLKRRGTASSLHDRIVGKAAGNWLIARLLADLESILPTASEETLPGEVVELYNSVLRQARANDPERWNELRPVLGLVAAAGVGPILPIQLLCAASGTLGGPSRPSRVRDVLVDLRGFVVRGKPGTDDEQVGVFHQTFAEYLLDPEAGEFGSEAREVHTAILEAIAELAPVQQHESRSTLHRYAAGAEAEHFWAIGRYFEAMTSLASRASVIPAENLARWKSWFKRAEQTFGPSDPSTLRIRINIVRWTGETGDFQEALRLCRQLLPDLERVMGATSPETLHARGNVAHWTGESGDAAKAVQLFRELLPDLERALGRDHLETLITRGNTANRTGENSDSAGAVRLFKELLPDQVRVLGPNSPDTLRSRYSMARWIGEAGDAAEALRLFQELLPNMKDVLGADHPDTLRTRTNVAYWTGGSSEALALFQQVLPDVERVFGANHPDTLRARQHIARWKGKTGESREALALFQQILPDMERILGTNHPDTCWTREQISYGVFQVAKLGNFGGSELDPTTN
jgi:NACHT domain/Tetratricopeptide repeat